MQGRDLARVDAQLGAKAMVARPCKIGQQAPLVIELGRDAGDRRREARDTRCDGEHAGGMRQALGAVGDVQVEVERVVERAEDEAHHAVGTGHLVRRDDAARAFEQREHTRLGHDSAHGMDVFRGFGLRQHYAGDA